jgi:N-acyl-D-amino-acid deacylase
MKTTLIQSGKIIDGTGGKAFEGHILLEGGMIRDVIHNEKKPPGADEFIDASGLAICPGFIDMHSHSDWVLPLNDHDDILKCLIEQGITTVIGGNCGFSPAPYRNNSPYNISALEPLLERPLDFSWNSMGEFLERLDQDKPAMNLAELAGHGTIRVARSNTRRGAMKPRELAACLDTLRKSFDEGAWGLSFGLGYDPGMYSPIEEIEAFCRVAAEYGRIVTVHLKALSVLSPTYPMFTPRAHNILALEEMIGVAKKTGIKLQLSHFIFVGRRSWGTARRAIRMVEDARSQGVDVMFDAFPYMCGNTTVNVVIPYWFLAKTPSSYHNRFARMRLRAELEAGFALVGFTYKDFQVMDPAIDGEAALAGLTIVEVAEKWNTTPFDALLKLSEESGGGSLMLFHTYSGEPGREDVIEKVLSHELCLFETDAVIKSTGYPNPAAKGSFPLILGPLVRDKNLFSLEDAVNRSTLASAERFGIKDRGLLSPGKAADIVVFDPQAVSDTPPVGSVPAGRPKGIRHVFINGAQVVEDGKYTGIMRSGQVLRI